MGILRRKKIKKHINTIAYVSIFMIVAIVVSVAAVSGREKTEFMAIAETETYVVDVVSRERMNLAVVKNQEEVSVSEEISEVISGVVSEEIASVEVIPEVSTNVDKAAEETTAVAEETTIEETTEDLSKYTGIFVMNTSGNLNIRSKADTSSEVVGILTEGNGGEVVQYGNQWTKVKSGNVSGYVATGYILIGEKADKALEENGYIATVNADTLLVRAARSTESSVLGMAANGSEYTCSKVYPKWVKIAYEGQVGYVSREFVSLEKVMTYAKTVEEIEAEQATEAPTTTAATENVTSASSSSNTTAKPVAPTTKKEESVKASYSDKYLLACLVACEAGGESYESKLAVANVVLNRKRSSAYPSSIEAVIYQSGQFGPASNGSLDRMLKNGPDSGSQKAANAALAGTNNVPGYLFFGRTSSININNLGSYRIIDSQVFY